MTSSEPETAAPPANDLESDKAGHLLTKRKPELTSLDKVGPIVEADESNKKQNLGFSTMGENDAANPVDERNHIVGAENGDQEDKGQEGDVDSDDDDVDEEDFEGGDDDIGDDEDEDEDEGEDEHLNGASDVVDRKGKGIMKDYKGKGKMIEESEDDSSTYSASLSEDDSDLSDDPLAEVDLDNILPTRTRRHTIQPGINISKASLSKADRDDK